MFKKSFTIALAVVLAFASVAACATGALQWNAKVIGYDVNGWAAGQVPVQYQVYNQDGTALTQVTGLAAVEYGLRPYAVAELKNPWVSKDYPNKEYADLYADGNKVLNAAFPTLREGMNAGVKYRNVDYMWEAAAPHRIYSKTQAYLLVDGAAQWYSNATYPTQYTGRNAQVKAERIYYGFADYKVVGADAIELVPAYMTPWVGTEVYTAINGALTAADLAPKAAPAAAITLSKADVAAIAIPKTYDIKLVGPGFDADGNQIPDAKTIIGSDIKTCNPANLGIADVIGITRDTFGNIQYADVTWTNSNYAGVYPYRSYAFLVVDGVVMDGRYEAAGFFRPEIRVDLELNEYPNAVNVEIPMENGLVVAK